MGLRMRKSLQLCKGVRLNFGLKGASLSFGTKGLRHTISTSGRRTTSVGIPGTGISYVKSHGSKKGKNENLQNQSRQRWGETDQNALKVEEYNHLVNTLKGLHKTCDETISWQDIKAQAEPFPQGGIGPKQAKALKKLENYKPGFFERLKSGSKKLELEKAVEQAAKEDAEDYQNWETLHSLADLILNGDLDAYLDVIYEMDPLKDLIDFGTDFEFGTENPTAIEVEFIVKADTVVPGYALSLTKTGKVSQKNLTKTAYYALVQDFICSCTIRIARDMFALLPVKTALVHAVDKRINTQIGREEEVTVLSVLFERDVLNGLNFDLIDPSDAINNFQHNMKFLKTAGFKPVDRIDN